MNRNDILHQRLFNQGLSEKKFKIPYDAVKHLGAVQAQDYTAAKWGISLRLQNSSEQKIDEALNKGQILRTHIMRPTWHFVAPEDIKWVQMLTSPRVNKIMGHYNRKLGLDEKLFTKTNSIIAKSLKNENFLTRTELSLVLKKRGIHKQTQALAHIVTQAELDAVICSGPRKGKQFTYALVEERSPKIKEISREKALEELIKRYFTSHGPATLHDFVWWSGLTTEDTKKGVELAKNSLKYEIVENQTFWFSSKQVPAKKNSKKVYLLANYDEYTIGYKSKTALYVPPGVNLSTQSGYVAFSHAIVIDGVIVGMWKRTPGKNSVLITTKLFSKLNREEQSGLREAANEYGEFFGLETKLD